MLQVRSMPFAGLVIASLLMALALAPTTAAHSGIQVGEYVLEIGWRNEPAYVGQPNAVQVTIKHHDTEQPVTDLAAGALAVVVSTAGIDSPSLDFEPAFDAVTGTGPLGEYNAPLVPKTPGDYALRLTGSIRGTPVDLTVAAVVEVETARESSGPDLVLLVGGAAVVLVLVGMAFLLLGVRSPPAEPPTTLPVE